MNEKLGTFEIEEYELDGSITWAKCRGRVNAKGWLEFTMAGGVVGVKRPGTFRKLKKVSKPTH